MSVRTDVKARMEALEEAYEFFLAYAAQGLSGDDGSKSSGQLRSFLSASEEAVDGVADCLRELIREEGRTPLDAWGDLLEVIERDAGAVLAALRLVGARESISSQLVDNLNANIHLRALLTDFFLVDELLG